MIVSILRPSPPGIIVLIPLARVLSPSCPFTGGMPGMLVMTFHSKSLAAIVASRTGSGSSNSLRNSVANSFFSADVICLSPIATDRYLVHPAGSRQHPAHAFTQARCQPFMQKPCALQHHKYSPALLTVSLLRCLTGGRPINRRALLRRRRCRCAWAETSVPRHGTGG